MYGPRLAVATTALVALASLSACGEASSHGQRIDAGTTTTVVSDTRPSIDALTAFRESAAEAPYWYTVDSEPSTTIEDAARGYDAAVIGVVEAATIDAPRPDALRPYDGAPTLYHLEVELRVDPSSGSSPSAAFVLRARVPVLTSGIDGLDVGRPAAERIAASAPVGATGVFVVDSTTGIARPVAFESREGPLVAYLASMDEAVASMTTQQLAETVQQFLTPACSHTARRRDTFG